MERANLDVLPECLNVDVTNGSKGKSAIGFKSLHQAFALYSLVQLLLD